MSYLNLNTWTVTFELPCSCRVNAQIHLWRFEIFLSRHFDKSSKKIFWRLIVSRQTYTFKMVYHTIVNLLHFVVLAHVPPPWVIILKFHNLPKLAPVTQMHCHEPHQNNCNGKQVKGVCKLLFSHLTFWNATFDK